jgi:hypothetical protein
MGARMVEKVGELELEYELLKGKLQESGDVENERICKNVRMSRDGALAALM